MADTRTVQVQAETQGAVPDGAASFAVHEVSSLLRMAPAPALFARVTLIMAADPAVERPATVQLIQMLTGRGRWGDCWRWILGEGPSSPGVLPLAAGVRAANGGGEEKVGRRPGCAEEVDDHAGGSGR
jgi:hypothetical protein